MLYKGVHFLAYFSFKILSRRFLITQMKHLPVKYNGKLYGNREFKRMEITVLLLILLTIAKKQLNY